GLFLLRFWRRAVDGREARINGDGGFAGCHSCSPCCVSQSDESTHSAGWTPEVIGGKAGGSPAERCQGPRLSRVVSGARESSRYVGWHGEHDHPIQYWERCR